MIVSEKLLNERYRFKEGYIPYSLNKQEMEFRGLFLEEVHKKKKYISLTECPYCANEFFTKISEVERMGLPSDIVICDFCDGCFKSTTFNLEANRYYYENLSYSLRGKPSSEDKMERRFWKRVNSFAFERFYFISYFLDLRPDRDLVVEFGCNDGANLYPWLKNGFDALGIELDHKMIDFGNKKGINIISGDLINCAPFDRKPRLIILSHVLEHTIDMNIVLERLLKMLEPDGYLFIEVPGIRVHGLGDALSYFDVEHNYNFDLNSLSMVLKKYQFEIKYVDEYIRVLCTNDRRGRYVSGLKLKSVSLNKIKAYLINMVIGLFFSKKKKLRDLLVEKKWRNLKNRILRKLQRWYFKYHYLSIIEAKENNETKYPKKR